MTDVFFASGIELVIVEGPFFTADEREAYLRWVRTDVQPTFMTLDVSFDESLRRAVLDPHPGRSISRNADWLRRRYSVSQQLFAGLPPQEVIVQTDEKSAEQAASEIALALKLA